MLRMIFVISLSFLLYTYIGYALIIFLLAKFKKQAVNKREYFPLVSIVVAAHNEEARIKKRIENLLGLDYPKQLLEIVIVSDGSDDRTALIAKEYQSQGVNVVEYEIRSGKAYCLSRVIPKCGGEIIVLGDVRQRFDAGAIKELVSNFSDENIGVVSGELVFEDNEKSVVGHGIDFYWKYEKFLRKNESAIDSTIGATGAIYAIRKTLFEPILKNTLLDDVLIPMNAVQKGARCIFEPRAVAYDKPALSQAQEARRKIRTIAGNFQLFKYNPEWLNPFANRLWIQTVSHKFLRIIAPVFIVLLFVSNLLLFRDGFFKTVFMMQDMFYLSALSGWILRKSSLKLKIFTVPYAFCMLNVFVVKGFWKFAFSDLQDTWQIEKIRNVEMSKCRNVV